MTLLSRLRLRAVMVGITLPALVLAVTASAHAPVRRADLVETHVGAPPAGVVPGGSFQLTDTVANRGSARARRSVTRYYLRATRRSVLIGARQVPPLWPGRSSRGRATLRAPAAAHPGRYLLVVCADAAHRVREPVEANNCSTAGSDVTVTPPTNARPPSAGAGSGTGPGQGPPRPGSLDSDGDGYPDQLDCAPRDAAIHPGAPDLPDPQFVDTNCDGIDGTAARAVFVSPVGDDASPGTRDAPKRTFAAAIPAAAAGGKDVYATFGTYTERLDVQDGVGVYGGYSIDWATRGAHATLVTGGAEAGSTDGAVAIGISAATTCSS
jgi:CARDB protein